MRSRLILALACGALAGCGTSEDSSTGGAGANPTVSMPPNDDAEFDRGPTDRRVRVERIDRDNDGAVDSSITYEYDDIGRLVSETLAFTDSAFSQVVTYQYEDGLLVSKSDGIGTITYVNEGGRVVAIEEPGGERATFAYDDVGRLVSFTESAEEEDDDEPFLELLDSTLQQTALVEYEAGLPARLVLDGGTISYGRDADGRLVLIEAVNVSGELVSAQTLTRDERDRIVELDAVGEFEQSLRLVYAEDRLASFVLSRPGATLPFESRVELAYTAEGLLDSVTTVADLDLPAGAERIESVTTYEYESDGCVGQPTNDPRSALIIEAIGATRASTAALECGYYLDEDF